MLPMKRTIKLAAGSCFILPQNGVVDYGPGVASQQIAVSSSMDSRNGNDLPKRPMSLEVTAASAFSNKTYHDHSDELDEGSLPCTPELVSDGSSCSGADEALDTDTRQLISQFLNDFTGLSKPRWNQSRALSSMKRVVGELLDKHRITYKGMVSKVSLDNSDSVHFISEVAQSLFSDGITNWGRITSLLAFGAAVSQHLMERNRGHCVEQVGREISSYLLDHQRDWLLKNNSWDGFVDFFQVSDPESTVRKSLMALAGFAGIGATLALLISHLEGGGGPFA